jgi:hypothetical protein
MRPLARTQGILTERVEDELLVYDETYGTAHCLAAEAAEVWRLCDGEHSPDQIGSEAGLPVERVSEVLARLGAAGLLESVAPGDVSRRDVAKRFAQLGAAALSAPLIFSIVVPEAAAAGSMGKCLSNSDCTAPNLCVTATCNPDTGNCVNTPKNCDDNNACTTDSCDADTGNCVNTPITCDNGNPCQTGSCDPVSGCVYDNVTNGTPCGASATCQSGVCTPTS